MARKKRPAQVLRAAWPGRERVCTLAAHVLSEAWRRYLVERVLGFWPRTKRLLVRRCGDKSAMADAWWISMPRLGTLSMSLSAACEASERCWAVRIPTGRLPEAGRHSSVRSSVRDLLLSPESGPQNDSTDLAALALGRQRRFRVNGPCGTAGRGLSIWWSRSGDSRRPRLRAKPTSRGRPRQFESASKRGPRLNPASTRFRPAVVCTVKAVSSAVIKLAALSQKAWPDF